ncbi:MAG: hypothetical protein M0Q91_17410 [Methanoregula sp.]|jgi:hypothetical protein|nr:hypothetical protein [Methanoregula sp.]
MTQCKGCNLVGCQRRSNPLPQCLPSHNASHVGAIWGGLRGMREIQRQDERVMSGVIDGENRDEF